MGVVGESGRGLDGTDLPETRGELGVWHAREIGVGGV